MSIPQLIKRLKENKIDIALSGADLQINFEGDMLSDDFLQEIKTNKQGIIDFLSTTPEEPEWDIPVAPEEDGYVLSSSQRRSWVASQFDESNTTYNMPGVYTFEGPLDRAALDYSFKVLLDRHESLRTIFREDEHGNLKQYIQKPEDAGFQIFFRDLQAEKDQETVIRQLVRDEILKAFDLVVGPIIRANLYQIAPQKWIFIYVTHHIICDGWSMGILFKELLQFYNARIKGEVSPLKPLRIHYKDYSVWQQAHIQKEVFRQHKDYWLKQFEGELPLLDLPADMPRPLMKSYRAGSVTRYLDAEQTNGIKTLCRKNGGTLFMGLLTAFKTLLYRYSNQTDLVVGFPIAGRDYVELEDQVGFYVNTLALRTRFSGSDSYRQLFANVKKVTLNAFEHQQYPFDELVDALALHRDMSRNPMFDAMMILQKKEVYNDVEEQSLGDVSVTLFEGGENPFSPFDVLFNFNDLGDAIKMRIEYNSDIFLPATVERMATHFIRLLELLNTQADVPIDQLQFLADEEQEQLVRGFNAKGVSAPVPVETTPAPKVKSIDFSLFYFGNEEEGRDKYRLLIEGAKFGDKHGYTAVWTPERHFNNFGGPYPNPSVLGAMIAGITENVQIRAGSVVIPLHSPLRIAEEWSVVDNISHGRAAIACASGWHANDFAILPTHYKTRHKRMYESLEIVQRLWKGEAVEFEDGNGNMKATQIYPKPVQPFLPYYISSAGNIETFISAGRIGAGVLTNMLHGTLDDVAVKIKAYRKAYQEAGHEPGKDRVVLMLHAFIGEEYQDTLSKAKIPFITYLKSSLDLVKNFAASIAPEMAQEQFTREDLEDMLEYSFERYVSNASLVGTKESCKPLLQKISDIGVDEVACLVDFGVETETVLQSLDLLTELRDEFNAFLRTAVPVAQSPTIAAPQPIVPADDFDKNILITDLFETQAAATPDNIAVTYGKRKFTYLELNEKANQFANYLRQTWNVQPEELVGIRLERNEWLPVVILGVLKSGAAYVPLDPEYPEDRISYMLTDSGCKVCIDEQELATFRREADQYPWENPARVAGPDNLAYVIYTSGSTGQPKGVAVPHSNLHHFFDHVIKHLTDGIPMVAPFIASYAFDISILQLFTPLLTGGTCVVVDKEQLQDMHKFAEIIKGVNFVDAVPGVFNLLANHITDNKLTNAYKHVKRVFIGGDAVPDNLLFQLSRIFPNAHVGISYGPTEATIFCTHLPFAPGTITPATKGSILGRVISKAEVYVLNEAGLVVPPGVTGEICIGGPGIARGYLNNPALTAEKFVPNPFREGERMYRSGDLGRWLINGHLEFMGRKDDQIKIRGHRIELGEIENTLERHPDIDAAVVIAKGRGAEKELVAYIVSDKQLQITDLRGYLGQALPIYMLPAYFVQLDALPLNPNGKIDRKQLPDPEGMGISTGIEYVAPRNETEEILVKIWQELLRRDKVGIKDDFFQLGGHSLKATRLASQIYKELKVRVAIKDLFIKITPEQQAELVQKASKENYVSIPVAPVLDRYPLSSAQRRMWILGQFEEGNIAYNMPGVYIFGGVFDVEAFKRAFQSLTARHEVLRTVFKLDEEGEVYQHIKRPDDVNFTLRFLDLRGEENIEAKLKEMIQVTHLHAFDLENGPLIKADIFQVDDNQWVFNYVIHHILSDGWSMGILMHELMTFYNAHLRNQTINLPALHIQYKDYAMWQQSQLQDGGMQAHREYWLKQLEGELPVFEFPGTKPRPAVKTYRGGRIIRHFDVGDTKAIDALNQQQGSTLFMALQAIVGILLYRYTGQDDLITGSPIASRDHVDLEDQIGFYLNTLLVRFHFRPDMTYRELLAEIKQKTLDGYEHQMFPFDELVNALDLKRDMSRNALFDVMVILQNTENNNATLRRTLGELQVSGYMEEIYLLSKFDISFEFGETDEGIVKLDLTYNGDIYSDESMIQLSDHFEQLIKTIITAPDAPISELDFLREEEKQQLLTDFNETALALPQGQTIADLFAAQATATPDNIALLAGETTITYDVLNRRANQLAAYLRQQYDIQPEDRIAIKTGRHEWMVTAILGVLKAGAAYVPVDPEYPQERIDFMLSDSGCKVVIDEPWLEQFRQVMEQYSGDHLPSNNKPHHLAYVIYTSGSTGQPKGVMIEHANAFAFISWAQQEFRDTETDVVFAVTSICFDLSVFEIFYALTTGKQLRILPNALAIPQFLDTTSRILLNTVPGVINALLKEQADFSAVRVLNMAGEAIPQECLDKLDLNRITVRNLYGPTETTTYSTVYHIRENSPVLIGRPVGNTAIYILNEAGMVQPLGAPGEICISGAGVARGYLGQPELTAQKFVTDPFRAGARMFKTGDLGYWLPDGNILLTGRKDEQVKVHGYRIELGEIENALRRYKGITDAVVAVRANKDGEKELVAYVVSSKSVVAADLRTFLATTLPLYMIPRYYVQPDALPLLPNGKTDRKNLPVPEELGIKVGVEYVAPRTQLETEMVKIWEDILGRERIGVKDNFFDAGGHSLKVIRLVSRVNLTYGIKLQMVDLFRDPTVENVCSYIAFIRDQEEQRGNKDGLIEIDL